MQEDTNVMADWLWKPVSNQMGLTFCRKSRIFLTASREILGILEGFGSGLNLVAVEKFSAEILTYIYSECNASLETCGTFIKVKHSKNIYLI